MLASLRKNLLLKIVSLLISLGIWLYVQLSKPQVAQQTVAFDVRFVNLDRSKFIVTSTSSTQVKVLASGTPEELKKLKGKEYSAYIDLLDAEPGLKEYPVRVNYPTEAKVDWERPPTVFVNLEPLAHGVRRVEVVQDDSLAPSGFALGEPTVMPEMVKIEGPQSRIDDVATARALVMGSKAIKPGDQLVAPVELLDKNNKIVPFVTAEPNEVTVRPTLAPIVPRHNLLVTPNWQGQPAFGFRVVSYTITPNQVEVAGDYKRLTTIATLETEPIPLSELSTDKTVTVALRVPSGLSLKGSRNVTVRIKVGAIETPSP